MCTVRSMRLSNRSAEWAAQGLRLGAGTLGERFEQLPHDPAYAQGPVKAALGDAVASGLTGAEIVVAGAVGPSRFAQAIRLTCRDGAPGTAGRPARGTREVRVYTVFASGSGPFTARPPSTGRIAPLTNPAAGESRNATTSATSVAVPGRPSGCSAAI
jgi:hypothetical protein